MATSKIDFIPDLLIPRQFVNNESNKKRQKHIETRKKNEDPEARIVRLEKNRLHQAQVRLNETPEKREARLEGERQRRRLMRQQCKEGPKYKQLLERQREYTAKGRLNETPEKREARRERERRNAIKKKLNEDPEKRRIRVERHRIYVAEKRRNEKPEERAYRLKRARECVYRQKHKIDQENTDAQLEHCRAYETRCRAQLKPDCITKTGQNIDLDTEKAPSEHESKPSHEHLDEIKHKKKFSNVGYPDYDIIDIKKEKCTEVIIPDNATTNPRDTMEELLSIKVEHTTHIKEEIYTTYT